MKNIQRALPRGLAVAALSTGLFLADAAPAQTIDTIAGNGTYGYSGDGGPATAASLSSPSDVAVDGAGNRYIAERFPSRIRKVTPAGKRHQPHSEGLGNRPDQHHRRQRHVWLQR